MGRVRKGKIKSRANIRKAQEVLQRYRALGGLLGRGARGGGRYLGGEEKSQSQRSCNKDKHEVGEVPNNAEEEEIKVEVEVKEETEDDRVNIEYHFVEDCHQYGFALGMDKKTVEESAYQSGPSSSSLEKRPVEVSSWTSASSKQQRTWSKGRPSILRKRCVKPPVLPSTSTSGGGTNQIQVCRCLLCFQEITNDKPKILHRNDDAVESNFRAMFILKKMLSVPNDKLGELLQQKYGQSPSEWMTFCERCTPLVNEGLTIQKEIDRLEGNLRKCQEEMISRIQRTWEEKEVTHSAKGVTGNVDFLQPLLKTRTLVVERMLPLREDNPFKKVTPEKGPSVTTAIDDNRSDPGPILDDPLEVPEIGVCEEDDEEEFPWEDEAPMPQVDISKSRSKVTTKKYNQRKQRRFNRGDFGCYLCPALLKMPLNDFFHHVMFHKRKPLKCTKCNLYFSSETEANLLSNSCVQNEDNQSSTCGSTSSSKICSTHSLTTVKYEAGNITIWKCNHCAEKFTTETERDLHEDTAHSSSDDRTEKEKKYQCNWCPKPKLFRNWDEWQLHRALEHYEQAPFCCPYCDQLFKLQTQEGVDLCDMQKLRSHLTRHHMSDRLFPSGLPPSPNECHLCGEIFWTTRALHRHMENGHGLSKMDSYSCPVCHLRKQKKNEVFRHLSREHHQQQILTTIKKQKEFFCESCGFKTTTLAIFEDHKFSEHGLPPETRPVLKCSKEECSFQCVDSKRMARHNMKEHGAERKHKCQFCGKGFLNGCHLRIHENIHKNAELKPYQCEICGNSFAVRTYLYIHMRLSHQNRPFASTHKKKPSRKRKFSSPPKPADKGTNPTNCTKNLGEAPLEFQQTLNLDLANSQFNHQSMEPQQT